MYIGIYLQSQSLDVKMEFFTLNHGYFPDLPVSTRAPMGDLNVLTSLRERSCQLFQASSDR
jgi:hypothetical protein